MQIAAPSTSIIPAKASRSRRIGPQAGWSEIRAIYEKLFASKGAYRFEFYDYTLHETGDLFYVVGRERGELDVAGRPMQLAIRTTRVFR